MPAADGATVNSVSQILPWRGGRSPVGVVHLALVLGGFTIGTAEFATMSLLPLVERGFGID